MNIFSNLKKNVLVISHLNPDGDSLGSQVAVCSILLLLGYNALCVFEDYIPNNLSFLTKNVPFINIKNINLIDFTSIFVDCSNPLRAGQNICNLVKTPDINIDHHIDNEFYAKKNIVNINSSSTCEILTEIFLENIFIKEKINKQISEALYTGIITDTVQLKYIKQNPELTLNKCSNLIKLGANPNIISFNLYQNNTIEDINILIKFLKSIKLELNGKLCIGFINKKLNNNNITLIEYTNIIKNVLIGATLFKIKRNLIKGSLRSNNEKIHVNKIAKKFDIGGGHNVAAGFIHKGSMNSVLKLLKDYSLNYMKEFYD